MEGARAQPHVGMKVFFFLHLCLTLLCFELCTYCFYNAMYITHTTPTLHHTTRTMCTTHSALHNATLRRPTRL
ncbi:hypothetical protein GGR54DRAFT_596995 [Hypoxylon sp. NC1633]|nr:hypothetical protein GGR54DRAFT_596995 [Hypoxylon sp. NC1633]